VSLVVAAAWHLAVFLALAAAVMTPIERMAGAPRSRWRRAPVAIALTAAGAMLTAAVSTWLASHAPALYDPGRAPDWPRFLGLVVSAEVAAYAVHRAMHGHRWLWRFHRVHHAPGPMFWLDAWRMHPVDAGLHLATGTALALLWDVPLAAHAPGLLLRKLYTGFLHAAGNWRPTFLDRVIATPAFHHRHHDGIRGNYAGMLSVLDLVLGTWNAGDPAAGRSVAAARAGLVLRRRYLDGGQLPAGEIEVDDGGGTSALPGRHVREAHARVGPRAAALMNVAEQVEAGLRPRDGGPQIGTTLAARHALSHVVADALGRAVSHQDVHATRDLRPLLGERGAARQVVRPVVVGGLPRASIEGRAAEPRRLVLEVDDPVAEHRAGRGALAGEAPVVVAGHDDLVPVGEAADPCCDADELVERAAAEEITRVHEDIAIGDRPELGLEGMCVSHRDDAHVWKICEAIGRRHAVGRVVGAAPPRTGWFVDCPAPERYQPSPCRRAASLSICRAPLCYSRWRSSVAPRRPRRRSASATSSI
jgi:sterol desaturase/sphingolipid hydroxylase (fatty acid hydroxylase superfamily)